jgi:hypothetical protein
MMDDFELPNLPIREEPEIRVTVVRAGNYVEIFECMAADINAPWFAGFTQTYTDVDDLLDHSLVMFITPAGQEPRHDKTFFPSEDSERGVL